MAKQTIQVADKPTLDEVKAFLENSGYGLEAIKTLLNTANTNASSANTYAKSADTLLKNSTYGLQAIKNALGSSGAVKSVQRGVITTEKSTSVVTKTITINSVNPDKCLIILNSSFTAAASGTSGLSVKSLTSTVLTILCTQYNIANNISWQVIEFY